MPAILSIERVCWIFVLYVIFLRRQFYNSDIGNRSSHIHAYTHTNMYNTEENKTKKKKQHPNSEKWKLFDSITRKSFFPSFFFLYFSATKMYQHIKRDGWAPILRRWRWMSTVKMRMRMSKSKCLCVVPLLLLLLFSWIQSHYRLVSWLYTRNRENEKRTPLGLKLFYRSN